MSRPKPSFKVVVPKRGSENAPEVPSTTSTFAVSGSVADARHRRKSKREQAFNSSQIQSSRLTEWNLNAPANSPPHASSSTMAQFGLQTPQTPWTAPVSDMDIEWPNGDGSRMQVEEGRRMDTFSEIFPTPPEIATPASCPSLHSPISLPRRTENVSSHPDELVIQALLDLGTAPRIHNDSLCSVDRDMAEVMNEVPDSTNEPMAPCSSLPYLSPEVLVPSSSVEPLLPSQIDVEVNMVPPRTRRPRVFKQEVVGQVLSILRSGTMSLWTFLDTVLAGEYAEVVPFRQALLSNHERLHNFLDLVAGDKTSKGVVEDWLKNSGRKHVCAIVSKEMEAAKPMLRMSISDVTTEFIERWDVNSIMDPVAAATPMWTSILHAATEPSQSWRAESTSSDTRNRPTTRNIISSSVHYLRSLASCKVPLILGTTAWASGASRRTLDILHQSASSVSYSSIGHVIEALANSSIEAARKLVQSAPHCFAYDNINLSHSIFIEQTANAPSKVQSGTLPVIYELPHANPDDMKLEPILARFRAAPPLKLSDLRPSTTAARFYLKQSIINVIGPLLKYVKGFDYLKDDDRIKHTERHPLPKGHKTKFYCLRVSTHEEASVHGNILLHDNVYRDQLQVDVEGPLINSLAIPTINDQLTNARIRGAQAVRMKDVSPYEQRMIFQIAFGTFHLIMNLLWKILKTHRGTLNNLGSLSYFFAILEKTRLGQKHPDYHTLLAALTQIIHGLLLNAWRMETGFSNLAEYAASKPSAPALLEKAWIIIKKYATPAHQQQPAEPPKAKPSSTATQASAATVDDAAAQKDQVYSNIVLLTRDLLYVLELVDATSSGDFGRVEDILPDIACIFRGTGSTNYPTEVMHFLHNVKYVWTPEYANIVRDNMLVNPSGQQGHAMAMDLNIEHLIRELKKQYSSKGIYGSWDYLGNISACIDPLQKMKKQVSNSLNGAYQGTTHSNADVSDLVWRVVRTAQDQQLQVQLPFREGVPQPKATLDARLVGRNFLESSTLAGFNKKLQGFKLGIPMEYEPDSDNECNAESESE